MQYNIQCNIYIIYACHIKYSRYTYRNTSQVDEIICRPQLIYITSKVTTATAEFAAPEVVAHDNVGFYTDMWAVGVLSYVLFVCFSNTPI